MPLRTIKGGGSSRRENSSAYDTSTPRVERASSPARVERRCVSRTTRSGLPLNLLTCMVPSSCTASSLDTSGDVTEPSTMAARKLALTYAASSTPGGTRVASSSFSAASSPAGGFFISSTSSATCLASSGLGTIPSAARSAKNRFLSPPPPNSGSQTPHPRVYMHDWLPRCLTDSRSTALSRAGEQLPPHCLHEPVE